MKDLYGQDFRAGEDNASDYQFFIQAHGFQFGQALLSVYEARLLQERLRLFVQKQAKEQP